LNRFFGRQLGAELSANDERADPIAGNNVLGHVPDLNDFVAGIRELLAPQGTVTIEVPHLRRLVEGRPFDTIYHEHFLYFSLATARRILRRTRSGDHGRR
jgi:2-polyprenyl-3-methyl-5-hydroxy-6-metoxy-1,4-benzoquinol methylase